MPNMDGIELIQALRSEPTFKFTPIVTLTTESAMNKKDAGKQAGATGWIVKPFKPEQSIAVVKLLLGIGRNRRCGIDNKGIIIEGTGMENEKICTGKRYTSSLEP